MSTLAIQFGLPVRFTVKLNSCRLMTRSAGNLEDADLAVILGEERAVGVNRLGFAPAAAAWPGENRDDFWWSCELSSVTNTKSSISERTFPRLEEGGDDPKWKTG